MISLSASQRLADGALGPAGQTRVAGLPAPQPAGQVGLDFLQVAPFVDPAQSCTHVVAAGSSDQSWVLMRAARCFLCPPQAIESYTVVTGLVAQVAEMLSLSNPLPPMGTHWLPTCLARSAAVQEEAR